MKINYSIIGILIFLFIHKSSAQTNEQEAQSTFRLAQAEYDKGNYQQSLDYLKNVDRLSESAKVKTSYLKAKCYQFVLLTGSSPDSAYTDCLNSISYYINKGQDNDRKSEILKLKVKVEEAFKEAKQLQVQQQKKEHAEQTKQQQINDEADKGYFTVDNQIFSIINLDVTTFNNGDPIPEAEDGKEWERACNRGKPAWCYYEKSSVNGKYGKMYNWYAITDSRGLAPHGWHIPNDEELRSLVNSIGGYQEQASKEHSQLFSLWMKNINPVNGGRVYRECYTGKYTLIDNNDFPYFWTNGDVSGRNTDATKMLKGNGYYVRCTKDK